MSVFFKIQSFWASLTENQLIDICRYTAYAVFTHYYLLVAYKIRLIAINQIGPVIHEFDPYFNFRATEYLYENGMKKFFKWFDYKSWYPLGRPIGTTIYPGMQFTAVWIKKYIIGDRMSLNDVCCYIPAWFGAIASLLVGLITYECCLECNSSTTLIHVLSDLFHKDSANASNQQTSKKQLKLDMHLDRKKVKPQLSSSITSNSSSSVDSQASHDDKYDPSIEAGIFAMGIMGMVPAHLIRSMGGGYDNESVAVSAMLLTFYFWVRSLRAVDDNSHFYGIAAGVAFFYMASSWGGYIFVSNLIALHAAILLCMGRFTNKIYLSYTLFYVVGTVLAIQIPIVGYAPITTLEQLPTRIVVVLFQFVRLGEIVIQKRNMSENGASWFRFRLSTIGATLIVAGAAVFIQLGYLVPVSSRIASLFLKLSKTGNPLVDSVAEHQPADTNLYFRHLQHLCTLAPIGFILTLFHFGDSPSFLTTYALVAWYFSKKMVRLIILVGPIASCMGGLALGRLVSWSFCHFCEEDIVENKKDEDIKMHDQKQVLTKTVEPRKKKRGKKILKMDTSDEVKEGSTLKNIVAVLIIVVLMMFVSSFQTFCLNSCRSFSNPAIVQIGKTKDGQTIRVDDYREAYRWLRDNTPEDARILSWWDYGYQITSISNRTTLCDGNTWNYEHIALIAKILTTNQEDGYQIARLLADYILIEDDDLQKSPHIAKIANSVYSTICPNDPTCSNYDITGSLLYMLHSHDFDPKYQARSDYFSQVYKSRYGKVRIFQILQVEEESKKWVELNKSCDTPDGWICPGQYPPKLRPYFSEESAIFYLDVLESSQDDLHESSVTHARLDNIVGNSIPNILSDDKINAQKVIWEDTEYTVRLWNIINSGTAKDLEKALSEKPLMAHMRSSDGRSAMHWAFEHRQEEMVHILKRYGVGYDHVDKYGLTPVDLLEVTIRY